MTSFVQVNFFTTTISAALTTSDTSLSLGSTTGAPSIPSGSVWPLILTANDIYEVVYVTALSGSTATVLRGQEGTTAQSWASGTTIYGAFTAGAVLYDGDSITADNLTVTGTSTLEGNVTVTATANDGVTINGVYDGVSLLVASGNNTNSVSDVSVTRDGSAANTISAGPNIELDDSGASTYTVVQHSGGQTEIWQTGQQLAFWGTTRGLTLNAASSGYTLTVNGSVYAQSYNNPSDERLKSDIRPIDSAMARARQIRGVFFKWKSDNSQSAGVLAQEVQAVFPEAVREHTNGTLCVDQMALIGLLFAALGETEDQR